MRIAVLLDALGMWRKGLSDSQAGGYLYNNPKVLWFVQTTSFAALNITCSHISSILANLLSAVVTIKQSHLVLKFTVKGLSIIVNIFILMVTVAVVCAHQVFFTKESNPRITNQLLAASICFTLSLLVTSSFSFLFNFSRIFKMSFWSKKLIEVGCVFQVVRLIFDIVLLTGGLKLLRMRSCSKNEWTWPLVAVVFEVLCNLIPLSCFTAFFSEKLSLSSQT